MPNFTYDLETNLGRVRLLISDVGGRDSRSFLYSDEEIETFLGMAPSVLNASALALRSLAGNETQVSKRIRFLDLETNGPEVARSLMELADRYDNQADNEADIDIAGMDVDVFSRRTLRGF